MNFSTWPVRKLAGQAAPCQAAADLIKLAIDGGGPDNVTCIVADIVPAVSPRSDVAQQPAAIPQNKIARCL